MARTTRNIVAPTIRPDKRRVSIIIPAAGIGSRMKSYGPKALIKIKEDLTIISNQLKYINKYFHKPEIILVAGFGYSKVEAAMSRKKNVKVIENAAWATTNVMSSIAIGMEHASYDNILWLYGDLVFNAWALKVPFGSYSIIVTDKKGFMKDEEVGCIVESNIVEHMMYGLPNKWAQIAYFTGNETDILKDLCRNPEYYQYFGFEIINKIIGQDGKFTAYSNNRIRITDIDSSRDLVKIQDII